MIKGSASRKRTRVEMEEFKKEETELKDDRKSFLGKVKKIKQENDALSQQVLNQVHENEYLGQMLLSQQN